MTTHELLELASLDALALLDEDERLAFDKAFAAAPASLQAQVRREQARIARADSLLPDVAPPASLKSRVLARVREAWGVAKAGAAQHDRADHTRDALPFLLPSRGVSRVWRTAAIACAAACVAFGSAMLYIQASVKQGVEIARSNALDAELLKEFAPRVQQAMFNPGTRFLTFSPAADADAGAPEAGRPTEAGRAPAHALLLLDPATRTGQLLCADLQGQYDLVVIDAKGNVARAVVTINSEGPKFYKQIDGLSINPGEQLAVVGPGPAGSAQPRFLLRSSTL